MTPKAHPMRVVLLLPLSLLLAACQSSRPPVDNHALVNTAAEGKLQGRPTLGMPTPIPSHTTVLIPFSLEDRKGWFDNRDPFSQGGYADRSGYVAAAATVRPYAPAWGGSVRWHNAIIRDLKTGDEWTILDRRGVISRWAAFAPPPPPVPMGQSPAPLICSALVFLATTEDTNHDGVLNDLDAGAAIVTHGDGRSPRAVSPSNSQVWSVSFDAAAGLIYLPVVTDSNGDGKFTDDDAPTPYSIDPRSTGPAVPIVSEAVRRRVEGWLK